MTVMPIKSPSSALSWLWCPSSHLQVLYHDCEAPQVTCTSYNMTVMPLKPPSSAVSWLWYAPQVTSTSCNLTVMPLKLYSSAVSWLWRSSSRLHLLYYDCEAPQVAFKCCIRPRGVGCGGHLSALKLTKDEMLVTALKKRLHINEMKHSQTPPYLCAALGRIQRTQTPSH